MKQALHTTILLLTLLAALPLHAQENKGDSNYRQLLEQADEDYGIGRFDQVLTAVETTIDKMKGTDKQRALRLAALCHLAMYQTDKAELYAQRLIQENRYYSSVNDPMEFTEIINRIRAGTAVTVTTASNIEESIDRKSVV